MDTKQIKSLMEQFDESTLSKLSITQENFTIKLEKATIAPVATPVAQAPVATPVAQASALSSEPALPSSATQILSPMVGTFYAAPSPDSPPFVKAGDIVKKGQVIAILEAMKIMNELEADFDFKVLETCVSDGQAVEYDMPLYVVEKI